MKGSTLFGIVFGVLAIFGAFIWEGGSFDSLFMFPAMLIVFGGTLAAGLAGSSWKHIAQIPKLIYLAIFPPKYQIKEIINQIINFAFLARKEGILSLESKLTSAKHPFLKKLFEICIDGADPDTLLRIVETEIDYISERHNSNINLFIKLGGFSPTMGIIGTVMGLIATLSSTASEPQILIHHIASAFIATMWGIFMANIVWLPVADKLKTLHNEEMKIYQVMLDGAYSVQLGEVPSVIRAKLLSAFPLPEQENMLKEQKSQRSSAVKHSTHIIKANTHITEVPIPFE